MNETDNPNSFLCSYTKRPGIAYDEPFPTILSLGVGLGRNQHLFCFVLISF